MKFSLVSRYLVLAASLVFFSGAAGAIQINLPRWNLQGVTFEDGASATGYFVWDASAPNGGQLQDFDIVVSGGDVATFPAFRYTMLGSSLDRPSSGRSDIHHLDGVDVPLTTVHFTSSSSFEGRERELRLVLSPMLTNAGGTAQIYFVDPKFGTLVPGECYNCGPWRAIVGGAVVAAVPEPETYALMLAGLGLVLGCAAHRRKRR